MNVGITFPRRHIGTDPSAIRGFAEAVDSLGYHHITIEEHVLGADPDRQGGFSYGPDATRPRTGTYITKDDPFNEPMVLAGFLAALTRHVELVTGVLVLPQRQTALVAKQATELDVLSAGRFRLGVGVGWNPVEYEGLGSDFKTRGARQEEQIRLMRALWTQDVVDFRGRWHRIDRAGLNPLPSGPIPIWLGGNSEAAMKRAASLGDGWMPLGMQPGLNAAEAIERVRALREEAGHADRPFGIEATVAVAAAEPPGSVVEQLGKLREIGVTHATLRPAPGDAIDSVEFAAAYSPSEQLHL